MLLDFGTAVLAGSLLSVASYLTTGTFEWNGMVAAGLVGATLAARKWVQTQYVPPAE